MEKSVVERLMKNREKLKPVELSHLCHRPEFKENRCPPRCNVRKQSHNDTLQPLDMLYVISDYRI